MKAILIETISISPFRHRKAFDERKLDELAASIAEIGLLHPIVVRFLKSGKPTIIAGERRLRAVKLLLSRDEDFLCDGMVVPRGMIPVTALSEITNEQFIEAELDENIKREDLTWPERVAGIKMLHDFRLEQNPKQTKVDTAAEIQGDKSARSAQREVDRALIVADHLEDESVAGAKDANEAFKIVSKKLEDEYVEELARRVKGRKKAHVVIHGDCTEVMIKLAEQQFDLVIADPPYGIDADQFGDAANQEHKYEDTQKYAWKINRNIISRSFDLCKPQAHLFVFCDIDLFYFLKSVADTVGWHSRRTPLIWYKGSAGHTPEGMQGWRRSYEMIFFATKGKKPCNSIQLDLLNRPEFILPPTERQHAAQKPTKLFEYLINATCIPGAKVLDPTCGSGTIFTAAAAASATATGIESDFAFFNKSEWIISQLGA